MRNTVSGFGGIRNNREQDGDEEEVPELRREKMNNLLFVPSAFVPLGNFMSLASRVVRRELSHLKYLSVPTNYIV